MNRSDAGTRRHGDAARGKPRKAQIAAGGVLLIQLAMQVLNFFRADLAPLKAEIVKVGESVARIEQRLEDHERRLQRLEAGSGESTMDKPKRKQKHNEDPDR